MNFITGVAATSSALNVEKIRMDVVAQNIANAHTTRDLDGQPYKRKIITFASVFDVATGTTGVKIAKIGQDTRPGELVHNPQHPHAGKDGMVRMPNVNPAIEMVDLLAASRAYEANISVARNSRQMANKALTIGR